MSNQKEVKSVEGQTSPSTGVESLSTDQLAQLIQVMLIREQRAAKAEQDQAASAGERKKQYAANRTDDEKTDLLRQASCKHLKGVKNRRKNAALDYNVSLFTYINGETVVKCLNCRMKWRPTDTVQFVVRNGKIYKNHTGKGWAEALELAGMSTNTPCRSEIPHSQLANIPKELALATPHVVEIDTIPVGVVEVSS